MLIWSLSDLDELGKLWNRAHRFALQLSPSTAAAVLVFPTSQGGLALPVPRDILLQELESLFLQCTASPDSTASIISQWMRQDLRSLGAATIAEAQLDLFLAHSPSARSASPWQLFLLLQYLAGSRVHWDEIREEAGADNPISLLSLSFPA